MVNIISNKKSWVKRHPLPSIFLGMVLVSTIASAFDGNSDYQTPNPTISSTPVLTSVPTPKRTPEKQCHPSYSGCLNPNASDYDCAGGSGNGPHYTGKVRVYGYDEFDLDRDGDGWGCE